MSLHMCFKGSHMKPMCFHMLFKGGFKGQWVAAVHLIATAIIAVAPYLFSIDSWKLVISVSANHEQLSLTGRPW